MSIYDSAAVTCGTVGQQYVPQSAATIADERLPMTSTDWSFRNARCIDGGQHTRSTVHTPAVVRSEGVVMRCVCGHLKEFHRHYRPGTDCGGCLCPEYRRNTWWNRRRRRYG